MYLIEDENGYRIQGFAPKISRSFTSGVFIPEETIACTFDNTVAITLGGVTIEYDNFIFIRGLTYTLGSNVNAHIMS